MKTRSITSKVNENDWKLFRKMIAILQENFMKKLLEEYKEILQKDALPSERFWDLEKKINSDKKCAGVYVVRSRSLMFENILNLAAKKAITMKDLEGLSDDIKIPVQRVLNNFTD